MKKFSFLFAAVFAALFSACSSDNYESSADPVNKTSLEESSFKLVLLMCTMMVV